MAGAEPAVLRVLKWLAAQLGLAPDATGTLTPDGESANLAGLACAQYRMLNRHADGLVYCSEQTDPAIDRAMHRLGFADGAVRRLPSTDGRLDVFALARAVRQDRAAGRCPFCVVANAGTADTGAVDNLVVLTQLCKAEGLWLHVDGSHGGCAALTARGGKLLRGLAHADSLALDLQRAFIRPDALGGLLLRDADALAETTEAVRPAQDMKAAQLWSALKALGADTFGRRMDRWMDAADRAEAALRQQAGWQLVSRSQLAIVTFRFKPRGITEHDADRLQAELAAGAKRQRLAPLTTIRIKGRRVLRLCIADPGLDDGDPQAALQWLFGQASRLMHAPRMHHDQLEPADTTV
jgi:glutamate/tyrosine decarboxylase-like PLP-dependent enzyme